jgi:calcineurin-like phosphoesterase family protein
MASHRKFQDEYYHDEHIIDQWNRVVRSPKDLTFILGDITMEKSFSYYQLDRLMGRKIVVLGNHDRHQDVREMLKYVENVAGMIDYKGFVLTHCPIHPQELYERYHGNIHGHIHEHLILKDPSLADYIGEPNDRYLNVSAEMIDYRPKTIEELLIKYRNETI